MFKQFILARDKFMPNMHQERIYLKPGFIHSACGPFTKHHERIQKFKETGNLKHICKNKLDQACFACDAAYSDSKDLAKRTISDKILKDKSYEIAMNSKYGGYQRGLAGMVYKFFDRKAKSRVSVKKKTENYPNQ